jgi:sigma-E factor negative regulatory protein RseC
MASEDGIIIKCNETTAMVKTIQSTACDSCGEKDICKPSGSGKTMEVEAVNTANAQVGDLVVVSFSSGQLFKLSFFLYVFPIIVMIIGALLGEHIAKNFHGNPSTFAAIFGFSFFFVAMGVVKLKDKQARKTGKYRPEIIKVKRKAQPGCPVSPVAAGE